MEDSIGKLAEFKLVSSFIETESDANLDSKKSLLDHIEAIHRLCNKSRLKTGVNTSVLKIMQSDGGIAIWAS